MGIFEGKTTTERNKIIAAGVLGVVSLFALFLAFGPRLSGPATTTSVTVKTSPTPASGIPAPLNTTPLPSAEDQQFWYETTPINYSPGSEFAPDPGRNIFAFYEPPPPCKDCPTPTPRPVEPKPLPPAPTPHMHASFINPQNLYAGSPGFRLEVNGDRFTPDSRIYFNQVEMPTTFINEQKLITDIPANLIAQEGPRQIVVQTPDGLKYSDQLLMSIQPPPRPGFEYIGMIGRKRYNNDTAYFTESGKPAPFGARLNDVVSGRFRLVDIAPAEVVFEDVNLGFKHRLAVSKSAPSASFVGPPQPTRGSPNERGMAPFDPGMQNIPGIPNNIPRYVPPPQVQQQLEQQKAKEEGKQDVDDAAIDP